MRYLTADYIVDENFRLVKNGLLIADKSGLILDFLNPEIDGEHIQDIEKSTIEVYKRTYISWFCEHTLSP